MSKVVAYILLFATLLPSVSPWGTVMYYNANKAYIARVLCENRARPQLHCDGKCYLAKKLKAQQDRQDKETTERVQSIPTLLLFCDDYPVFVFVPPGSDQRQARGFAYHRAAYSAPLTAVFHPPGTGC